MISKSVFIITIKGDVFMENRKTIPYTEKIKKIVNDIMNEKMTILAIPHLDSFRNIIVKHSTLV